MTIGLSLLAASAPSLVLDDFENPDAALGWTHKPNVELRVEDGALRADIDFHDVAYGWFRKDCQDAPLDLSPYECVRFRLRGGPGYRVRLHIMTDASQESTHTFALARPFDLTTDEWQTHTVFFDDMIKKGDGRIMTKADLSHVEQVNLMVYDSGVAKATLHLDDLVAGEPSEEARQKRKARLSYRRHIPNEAAFFDMLDTDRFPGLAAVVQALPDHDEAKAALLTYMRERKTPRYYFDPSETDALATAIKDLEPNYPPAVMRSADRLLTHRYSWEGETRPLARPIDYRQQGREWSAVLNRFGFLTHVMRAWWLTGDERYAEEIIGQLCEWAQSCPMPLHGRAGRTWHPLEAGCRAHSWIKLYLSALHADAMTPESNYIILKSLAEHARFLSDPNLSMGAPNMVIVESTGLAGIAMMFPEFTLSADWYRRGIEVLDNELSRRVLPDGAWEEVTPGYHSMVASSCLGFSVLASRNDAPLPDGFTDRFRAMYRWLLTVAKPNGRMPMLGDASDAPLSGLFIGPALRFEDPMLKYFARDKLRVNDLEMFGPTAVRRYTDIPKRRPDIPSVIMPDCALAVMRTGYEANDSYLLFDFGPIWSHTHQDTLGFSLYAKGQTLLWDSGVSNYNMPECYSYYRQARGHNVVLVDNADMKLEGRPRLHAWRTDETVDVVDAEAHFSPVGVRHRRQIVFLKPDIWVVRDVLSSAEPHEYAQLFHVREKATVELKKASVRARDGDGPTLSMQSLRPGNVRIEKAEGLITYHHGRGPGNNNLPAPVVRLVTKAPAGHTDLITLIAVSTDESTAPRHDVDDMADGTLRIRVQETEVAVSLPPLAPRGAVPAPVVTTPIPTPGSDKED